MIKPNQIKAARALLDWSQEKLARVSGLSPNTIYNLEKGFRSPRSSDEVEKTLRNLGLEIIGDTGVNLIAPTNKTYEGQDSTEQFLADLHNTIRKTECSISAVFMSEKHLLGALGQKGLEPSNRICELGNLANIKCLLIGSNKVSIKHPSILMRSTADYPMGQLGLMMYADKTAIIFTNSGEWMYYVIRSVEIALNHHKEFHDYWNASNPI